MTSVLTGEKLAISVEGKMKHVSDGLTYTRAMLQPVK